MTNDDKDTQKILLSGLQPSGRTHIGNYFGSMRQLVELQGDYQSFFMIADYHALTTIRNAETLVSNIFNLTLDYLAIGLDPSMAVIFKQSDVPAHTECAWIFDAITPVAYLERAHAYKDAIANNKEATAGLFTYPLLMAADILLYDADVVPVGADQKQHVEYARDTAEKFNHIFGTTFKLPKEYIVADSAIVPGTDGRKMSKSYGNTIPLFAEEEEIESAVMSIVTDSKGSHEPKDPQNCNVFALHKFFSKENLPVLKERYVEGGIGYKESKEILIENLKAFVAPLRTKRKELLDDRNTVLDMLEKGGEKARNVTEEKMKKVRKKIGVAF